MEPSRTHTSTSYTLQAVGRESQDPAGGGLTNTPGEAEANLRKTVRYQGKDRDPLQEILPR